MRILIAKLIAACILISITASAQHKAVAGPHVLVYKTKADYRKLVAVTLSDDGMSVVNYPDPQDIKAMGARAWPTKLHKGYLLDNCGISAHTAYLKLTYTAYAKLQQAPTAEQLMKMVKVKEPLKTMCDCGLKSGYKDPVKEMNKLIDAGTLAKHCQQIDLKK